jgi:hypothetical protein
MTAMTKSQETFRGIGLEVVLFALAGGLAAWSLHRWGEFASLTPDKLEPVLRSTGSTVAQMALTLAGFILTSTAIFTAFSDKPLVRSMYDSGHAQYLIILMYIAIGTNIVACVLGMWVAIAPAPVLKVFYAVVGSGIAALVALASVLRKLAMVLLYINRSSAGQKAANDPNVVDVDMSIKAVGKAHLP